uniref:Uncharacterized protein n=1 Tax=Tetranychus urticae TaxID=32264 RepID=T1KIQ7_TETUR
MFTSHLKPIFSSCKSFYLSPEDTRKINK